MKNKKIYIVASTFYKKLIDQMVQGAINEVDAVVNNSKNNVKIVKVPGAFEIPGMINCIIENENPDLILLEGQSSLRNPSGPCGSEYLCSALAKGVIIQYAPRQKYFLADDERELWTIPPIEEELELIRLYGSKTLAVTLNSYNLTKTELLYEQKKLETRLGVPVICPKEDGMGRILPVVKEFIAEQKTNRKV